MTVKELIEQLSKLDQELHVFIPGYEGGAFYHQCLIEKLKTLRLYFVRKRCFEVYFTDTKSGKEGRINVWVKDVDEVEPYFEKHFPHLELYDIGEC